LGAANLPVKNTLTASDAQLVEEAFQSRITALELLTGEGGKDTAIAEVKPADPMAISEGPVSRTKGTRRTTPEPASIDKSSLSIPEPRRVRDRDHIKFVCKQPCLVCGRQPADAHHLRFAQHPALGRKVSDEFTVPLCRVHHREVHRCGDEAAWWRKSELDPLATALGLWARTRPHRSRIPPPSPARAE
jgi:hypothetical protein